MSDTSAPLVAAEVAACCQLAIHEIEQRREAILGDIIASKAHWAGGTLTESQTIQRLAPEEKIIPQMHRTDDKNRLDQILELALSIAEDNPDLRMQVSLTDFQLIKRFYKQRHTR